LAAKPPFIKLIDKKCLIGAIRAACFQSVTVEDFAVTGTFRKFEKRTDSQRNTRESKGSGFQSGGVVQLVRTLLSHRHNDVRDLKISNYKQHLFALSRCLPFPRISEDAERAAHGHIHGM
jgi:hypothetical protein